MNGELEAEPVSSSTVLPPHPPPRPARPPRRPESHPHVPPRLTGRVTSSRATRPPTCSRPRAAPSPPTDSSDRSRPGLSKDRDRHGPPAHGVPPARCALLPVRLPPPPPGVSAPTLLPRRSSFERVSPLPSRLSHRVQGVRSISGSVVSPRGETRAVRQLPITPASRQNLGPSRCPGCIEGRRGGAEEAPWVQPPSPALPAHTCPGLQPHLERQVSPP